MKKDYTFIVSILCILLLATLIVREFQRPVMVATTPTQAQLAAAKYPTLPRDAVKVSGCIPFEGEHYVQPDKLPNGPLYSVHNGKVVAVEFMFEPKDIPGEKEAKMTPKEFEAYLKQNSLADLVKSTNFMFELHDYPYKTLEVNWASPHSGIARPHFDIHLYLVDQEELNTICPDATLETALPPEVMQNIEKHNIEFPGIPAKQ